MSILSTTETTLAVPGRHIARQGQQARRPRSLRRDQQDRYNRPIAERLDGYVQILTNHRRRLANVSLVYQEQPSVYLLQVEDTLRYLMELRRLAGVARTYLDRLAPAETQRLRPYGCITKLASLDYLFTELLLTVAMFAQVCQVISPERVQVHMEIRSAFPALLAAYDDLLAQLSVLADKARQPQERNEGGRA